jgi:glucokinase
MLSNTVALFDPETIILSGGLMNAADLLLGSTTKSFNKNVLELHKEKVAIVKSQFKEGEAAILGASSLINDVTGTGRELSEDTHRPALGKEVVTG